MSIVSQLNPDGKEIEINGKKYTKDSKITFNMKAFISLVIIIGTMFYSTYYFMNSEMGSVKTKLEQLKDEDLKEMKSTVDATNAKMELLMMLINSGQVDINTIGQPSTSDTLIANTPRPLNN